MRTSADIFAENGNPLATAEDWKREMSLAANPRVDTRTRESAIAYTQRASMTRRQAKPRPEFWEISQKTPLPPISAERENLKLMLAGLGAHERTLVPVQAQELAQVERAPRVAELSLHDITMRIEEPMSYDPPARTDHHAEAQAQARAHWSRMRDDWAAIAADPRTSDERRKRAQAHMQVAMVELEILA